MRCNATTCTREGCERAVYARKLCVNHYQQARYVSRAKPCVACATAPRVGSSRLCAGCLSIRDEQEVRAREAKELQEAALRELRGAPKQQAFVAAYCPECGDAFVMTEAHARMGAKDGMRFCSLSCGRRSDRRNHAHLRRSRREGKRIYRARILERDGWACRLCGDPLDMEAVVPAPLAPVMDHIVPLARGGEHAHYNVQAAHFICNSHKRDLLDGQVAMPV